MSSTCGGLAFSCVVLIPVRPPLPPPPPLVTPPSCTVHGPIDLGDTFGGLSWSPCETFFVYVAEVKDKKGLSFYSSEDGLKGTCFTHKEDYGEQMGGAAAPQVHRRIKSLAFIPQLDNTLAALQILSR